MTPDRIRTATFSLLACAALVGCNSTPKVTGAWTMDVSSLPAAVQNNPMVKNLVSSLKVTFNKDSTFDVSIPGKDMKGTFTESGDVITMTPTTDNGKPISSLPATAKAQDTPSTGTLSADGKKLTLSDSSSPNSKPVTFVRATAS